MPADDQLRDYLRRVTLELRRTKQRLRDAEDRLREPIAIVGMSCRFPGGVRSPEDLWRLLLAEQDAVTTLPSDRGWERALRLDGVECPRKGGYLHDAADFDPEPFRMTEHDALATDPQQRLLLETAWEALERAGIAPTSLRGSATGVFAGVIYNDYGGTVRRPPDGFAGDVLVGSVPSLASGRISYALGLRGPAVTVDTACSSALVGLHSAVHALRNRECSLALVGGATVMATPVTLLAFTHRGALAADGRSKSFSAAADGWGLAEGAGMLALQRLSDARREGRPVLAVVRGSAVVQDGASHGLTAPNGQAHRQMIRQALDAAGLPAAAIDAVEGHGTGTPLGDPIEVQALLDTYGADRPRGRPLRLGSVKSNLGHTQAAGGVAAVVKVVLALRRGVLPRSLHAEKPSPHVEWQDDAVRLLTEALPWPETGQPRRAAVSSFGVSGTNAHVVVEQAPPGDAPAAPGPDPEVVPWLLSAASPPALRAQAARLAEHLAEHPELRDVDVARSLATGRAALEHRAGVVAAGPQRRREALTALAEGRSAPGLVHGPDPGDGRRSPERSFVDEFCRGGAVDWCTAFPDSDARSVDLPTYAFQRRRYWLDAERS
ncbi:beta-ketoacyl synthase N-terminal-like domain-containing protein [Saccharopolyspora rosea]|nr:beta-ketoacyl synthase N-terminal-like domain-containing protein [Saccharopolyspora rosea]